MDYYYPETDILVEVGDLIEVDKRKVKSNKHKCIWLPEMNNFVSNLSRVPKSWTVRAIEQITGNVYLRAYDADSGYWFPLEYITLIDKPCKPESKSLIFGAEAVKIEKSYEFPKFARWMSNSDNVTFKNMPDDVKRAYFDAAIDGVEMETCLSGVWDRKISGTFTFNSSAIYRLKAKVEKTPIKDIPWDIIDDDYICAYVESSSKPKVIFSTAIPGNTNNNILHTSHLKHDLIGIVAEHSLTMRPKK